MIYLSEFLRNSVGMNKSNMLNKFNLDPIISIISYKLKLLIFIY